VARWFGAPVWWGHPEAVARLTALWRAWEVLRLDPATGMSNWWTLHFDPHMPYCSMPSGARSPRAPAGSIKTANPGRCLW
jgi:hypothetical protein